MLSGEWGFHEKHGKTNHLAYRRIPGGTRPFVPMTRRASRIATDVRAGRSSARAECAAALDRIEAARALNAIVATDRDLSLREAAAVDARLAEGADLPLAGVPIVVKDLVWVAGRRITQGSRLFADHIAPRDADVVARVKGAGAVVVGIANTSEFGCKGITTNPLHGPTLHPLDPRLTPGGSSGGCASAIAAGLVPLAIGTDSGGSSRRPAAHVGCVGFKPGAGTVKSGPGFPTLDIGLDALCPMAADVADARLLFETMAPGTAERAAARPRLAVSPSFGMDAPVDPEIAAMLDAAVTALEAAGLPVERRDPHWPEGADPAALMPLQHAMLADLYGPDFERDPGLFDADIAAQIDAGLRLDARAVSRALRLSAAVRAALDAAMDGLDALLTPTAPCFAWPHTALGPERIGGWPVGPRGHAVFTPYLNHAGMPAISLPMGKGRDGLPAGLQVCGPRGTDLALLDLAGRIEAVLSGGIGPSAPKRAWAAGRQSRELTRSAEQQCLFRVGVPTTRPTRGKARAAGNARTSDDDVRS